MILRNGKPAIEVKDNGVSYAHIEPYAALLAKLPDSVSETAYNEALERFWFDAGSIAERYDYGAAFSEGRSGGWLTVEKPPPLDPREYDPDDEARSKLAENAERWQSFEREIEALIDTTRALYLDLLRERLVEHEAHERRQSAIRALDDITLIVHAQAAVALAPRRVQESIVYDHSILFDQPEEVKP